MFICLALSALLNVCECSLESLRHSKDAPNLYGMNALSSHTLLVLKVRISFQVIDLQTSLSDNRVGLVLGSVSCASVLCRSAQQGLE